MHFYTVFLTPATTGDDHSRKMSIFDSFFAEQTTFPNENNFFQQRRTTKRTYIYVDLDPEVMPLTDRILSIFLGLGIDPRPPIQKYTPEGRLRADPLDYAQTYTTRFGPSGLPRKHCFLYYID